jgi:hypothetical protein
LRGGGRQQQNARCNGRHRQVMIHLWSS